MAGAPLNKITAESFPSFFLSLHSSSELGPEWLLLLLIYLLHAIFPLTDWRGMPPILHIKISHYTASENSCIISSADLWLSEARRDKTSDVFF